jgi:hypothetical protein
VLVGDKNRHFSYASRGSINLKYTSKMKVTPFCVCVCVCVGSLFSFENVRTFYYVTSTVRKANVTDNMVFKFT